MNSYKEQWLAVLRNKTQCRAYEARVRELDAPIGSFLSFHLDPPPGSNNPPGALSGIPLAVKDNIAVRGRPLTCGSRILENFQCPYTASAVEKLMSAGARIAGKTNLDEFGMGSSNENSALGETVNPWNHNKVPGGSSGGSAAAVAAGFVPLALGSDTGGSVRQPANFCGVYGLKPTYGTVSRYGLTAYASSLEVIGLFSRDIALMEEAFTIMRGFDPRDQSSINPQEPPVGGKKAAVLKVDGGALDGAVSDACKTAAERLGAEGYEFSAVQLPSLKYVVPAYYTIAAAEASANLARYNGMRYGYAPDYAENPRELMKKARHEGFGPEVKLRILLGTYVLRSGFQEQYYGRAQKIRTLIRRELDALFKDYNFILMPVFPTQAFSRGGADMDDYQQRLADVFTSLANLAGNPALAVPTGMAKGLPAGVQLMAPHFAEARLFQAAGELSKHFSPPSPEGSLDIRGLA
ncbi:MAG: glutaminyl-tRNA synthase (glutamine-hydrolyzing) subunit A [Spirochaeta sp. LUC14_002_19_P3]|nr:MAG: glutaminyl-tRNA synthase (glutamine-hydrolyzing) subunit A [Spirochaeta sp. LUC14_002_19_P3]